MSTSLYGLYGYFGYTTYTISSALEINDSAELSWTRVNFASRGSGRYLQQVGQGQCVACRLGFSVSVEGLKKPQKPPSPAAQLTHQPS